MEAIEWLDQCTELQSLMIMVVLLFLIWKNSLEMWYRHAHPACKKRKACMHEFLLPLLPVCSCPPREQAEVVQEAVVALLAPPASAGNPQRRSRCACMSPYVWLFICVCLCVSVVVNLCACSSASSLRAYTTLCIRGIPSQAVGENSCHSSPLPPPYP